MADIESVAFLLDQSLNPETSKQAESNLRSHESTQGFPLTLLHVVASANLPTSSRLAGALYFKNFIKRRWIDEDGNFLPDATLIKSEIVPLMISLPNNLQVQIGEAISIIADTDFPEKWLTLVDDLVSKLSEDDMVNNKGVLTVAHSIFKRWRPLFRSDELFLEIKMVLGKFSVPFLNLIKRVDTLIDENQSNKAKLLILFDVLLLLIKIYYDLNCQDIPEFFEDNLNTGMSIIHKYLVYSNALLVDDSEGDEVDIVSKVKASISELIQLYITRYEDVFEPLISQFIQTTWNLLTSTGAQNKYDMFVSKLLSFLTSVAKSPRHSQIFNNENALKEVTKRIIIPNLTIRECDVELFEDDPIEYIRRDLEGSDSDTRRRASIDFLRELKLKNEALVTDVIFDYIKLYLKEYESDKSNWKYKDLSIYLFTALAAKGSVTNSGISSTNLLLDVVQFFTANIVSDLMDSNIHPILKVDAIKYIYTFRNQLTKDQLLESFPILATHLQSSEYVQYTYSAITIERILSIRDSNQGLLFKKNDIQNFSKDLLTAVFGLILKNSQTPDKLAENEYLMKTVMRILIISEDSVSEYSVTLVEQLLSIVHEIAKNPSNPKFTHFTFESIGAVLKFNHTKKWQQLSEAIIPSLLNILGQDVEEFNPYIFQIFSYILESSPASVSLPTHFKQLIQPLLSPGVWEFKANIPAVTRLLRAIVKKDQSAFEDLVPLLGVFQKLISSRLNQARGFNLLESILISVPDERLKPYAQNIASLLLQRLQSSRTVRYVKLLLLLVCKLTTIKSGDYAIGFFEQVQNGVFKNVYEKFFIEAAGEMNNLLEKKMVIVGLTNLIENPYLMNQNLSIPTIDVLLKSVSTESIQGLRGEQDEIAELEFDEASNSSFGAIFSKLVIINERILDPFSSINGVHNAKLYFVEQLNAINNKSGGAFFNQLKQQLSEDGKSSLSLLI